MPYDTSHEELFRDGSSVQIEFRDANKRKKVFKTIIEKKTDHEIVLSIPGSQSIPTATKLVVICRRSDDLQSYFFTAEVISFHQGNPASIMISMPTPLQTSTRRKFFRCEVDLSFVYHNHTDTEYHGRVINLSASGLFALVTNHPPLKISESLDCQLHLPTMVESLKFEGRIIRIENTENQSEKGIALNFENTTEKFQNEITKYLFQRQRELIKLGYIKAGRV